MEGPQEASTVEYRKIKGFPGYRVGGDGTVWTRLIRGRKPTSIDSLVATGEWRILRPGSGRNGHLFVYLANNGKRKFKSVHHLVLEAFAGPCPAGMEGCHFPDRDPSNNRTTNLRWDTRKANHADAKKHGTWSHGERHGASKLTEADVSEVRKMRASGMVMAKIAIKFGVSDVAVNNIIKGKTWRNPPCMRDSAIAQEKSCS